LLASFDQRHEVYEFLMQWPIRTAGPHLKPFSIKDYPERTPVRTFVTEDKISRDNILLTAEPDVVVADIEEGRGKVPLWSPADLKFIDLLFCDTIAYGALQHRNMVKSQLLDNKSLTAVASRCQSFKRDLEDFVDERRKTAEKLEA
jgi:hypothetical protein